MYWCGYCSPFNQYGRISQGSYLLYWYTLNWKRTDHHDYICLWHNSVTIYIRHWMVLVIDCCHRDFSIYRYRESYYKDKSFRHNVNCYTGKTEFYIELVPEYFAVWHFSLVSINCTVHSIPCIIVLIAVAWKYCVSIQVMFRREVMVKRLRISNEQHVITLIPTWISKKHAR